MVSFCGAAEDWRMKAAAPRIAPFRRTFIREWRKHRKMTLEQLAAAIDQVPSNLSMLERGVRGYTQETLEKIASALRTTTAALIERAPGEADAILTLWDQARPRQRQQIVDIARTIIGGE